MERMDLVFATVAAGATFVGGGLWLGSLDRGQEDLERRMVVVEAAPLEIVALKHGQNHLDEKLTDVAEELKEQRKLQEQTLAEVRSKGAALEALTKKLP